MGKSPHHIHRPAQDYPVFDCRQLREDQNRGLHVFTLSSEIWKKEKLGYPSIVISSHLQRWGKLIFTLLWASTKFSKALSYLAFFAKLNV